MDRCTLLRFVLCFYTRFTAHRLLTLLKLRENRLYIRVLHHVELRGAWPLLSLWVVRLYRRTLTSLSAHCNSGLNSCSRFLGLGRKRFVLLDTVAWLVHVTLLWCCWPSHKNTWFAVADRPLVTNLLCWLLIHWVCLSFAGWYKIYIARFQLLLLTNKLDRVYLVVILVYAVLLLLVLRY
jgi:hypothetical protein